MSMLARQSWRKMEDYTRNCGSGFFCPAAVFAEGTKTCMNLDVTLFCVIRIRCIDEWIYITKLLYIAKKFNSDL